ncbi:MAG: DUF4431 domain-containing protein [Chlamydiota bacterium]
MIKLVLFVMLSLTACAGLRASDVCEEDLDRSLVLNEGDIDTVVALSGPLFFKIFPGPPNHESIENGDTPLKSWFLKMDAYSLEIALTTPVSMSFQTPKSIREWSNYDELELGNGFADESWLCDHLNRDVIVQGILFHAHTGHHGTPILMDVIEIFE